MLTDVLIVDNDSVDHLQKEKKSFDCEQQPCRVKSSNKSVNCQQPICHTQNENVYCQQPPCHAQNENG